MLPKVMIALLWAVLVLGVSCNESGPSDPHLKECKVDTDCPSLHVCHSILNLCEHKPVFPLQSSEIYGSLLVIIVAGLANAGGLGGGAILTPILMIFFGYSASASVMLSYILVFGGSLGNFFLTGLSKDPETGRRVVNYDLAMLCLPLLLMGTLIGVKINRALPEIAIILVLVTLIVILLKKVTSKATSIYQKENAQREAQKLKDKTGDVIIPRYSAIGNRDEDLNDGPHPELTTILEEEKNVFPVRKLTPALLLVVLIIGLSVIKGTKRFPSHFGIEFCGVTYWSLLILAIAVCYAVYHVASHEVVKSYEAKERLGFPFEDEFRLNTHTIGNVSMYAFIAGVMAGVAGIGGGMIMSPLLLEYGLRPQSASSTSSLTVVFTSFISLTLAVLGGFVDIDQVVWFFCLSILGSLIVSSFLNFLVQKFKRQSIILFTLIGVIATSLIVIVISSGIKVIQQPYEYLNFKSVCS